MKVDIPSRLDIPAFEKVFPLAFPTHKSIPFRRLGLNKILAAYENKGAEAICTFAFCEGPGHEVQIFQGRTHVSIFEILIVQVGQLLTAC